MLADDETALRAFLARILGWSGERTQAIEQALRSIHLSIIHRAALVLLGDTHLVSIALALHRLTLGAGPFVTCDPRRGNTGASVRAPVNYASGVDALRAALGGSLCIDQARTPRDLALLAAMARDPSTSAQIIILAASRFDLHPFIIRPTPILIPPLTARASEIPRIVDEYAADAVRELSAEATGFTTADRDWVIRHSASTLPEIEKGARRLVAIRQAGTVAPAAVRLEMSRVALSRWLRRRIGHRAKGRRGKEQP